MKLHWLITLVALSSLVNAQDEFEARSSFRVYGSTTVVFDAERSVSTYESALLIPFKLQEVDPSYFYSYSREFYAPEYSVSGEIGYLIPWNSPLFVELNAGYNYTSIINHTTGPTEFDLAYPALNVEDEISTYSIGPTLGFDFIDGWRMNLEIYAGVRYFYGVRELEASLVTLDRNEPTEEWRLFSDGINFNFGARWVQTFDSGLGYSFGLTYVTNPGYVFRRAERSELYLADYSLQSGTEVQWTYEGENNVVGNLPPIAFMNQELNWTQVALQVGILYLL